MINKETNISRIVLVGQTSSGPVFFEIPVPPAGWPEKEDKTRFYHGVAKAHPHMQPDGPIARRLRVDNHVEIVVGFSLRFEPETGLIAGDIVSWKFDGVRVRNHYKQPTKRFERFFKNMQLLGFNVIAVR